MIDPRNWLWYGFSGHFICGQWCRFHLCTEVGDYLISTVGKMVHPRHSGGSERAEQEWTAKNPNGEEIGGNRFYETMVFNCPETRCTETGCECGMPLICCSELEGRGYQNAGEATAGHMALCLKYAKRKRKQPRRKR